MATKSLNLNCRKSPDAARSLKGNILLTKTVRSFKQLHTAAGCSITWPAQVKRSKESPEGKQMETSRRGARVCLGENMVLAFRAEGADCLQRWRTEWARDSAAPQHGERAQGP